MTRHKAQGLVEFAFVFPIFLLLTLALIDFGRAAWQYNALADIARQAARQREIGSSTFSSSMCDATFGKPCSVYIPPATPPSPSSDTAQIAFSTDCPPTVTVRYAFQPVITFLGSFPWVGVASSSTPGITLTASSVVPNVPGVCP
jgi:Flp pilus assembly protein TadG